MTIDGRSWPGLSLSQRFTITGGIVMLAAMVAIGLWVTEKIEKNVVDSTAAATALYMNSFISPLAQELQTADTLSIGPIRAIEEMLTDGALGQRIVAVKVWKPGGLVAYSDEAELVGKRFPPSASLQTALSGTVVAEFDDLSDEENETERGSTVPMLEIYSPLRQPFTGKIIGALEFYENASALQDTLDRARWQTWLIVAGIGIAIGACLFGIVHRASRLIEAQRAALVERIAETERVSGQNRQLRLKVERAARRVTELNERMLRRISAELHDGPKQLMALAALRVDALAKSRDTVPAADVEIIRNALNEAMREIGHISANLAIPEIEALPISDVILKVTNAHRLRTETDVATDLEEVDIPVTQAARISVYRFVQEGLNNAFRHAGGRGQHVSSRCQGTQLRVRVSNDAGTPIDLRADRISSGLGLSGLRERIESLGGTFVFDHAVAGGAILEMTLDLDSRETNG